MDLIEESCGRVHVECEYSEDPNNLEPCSAICQNFSNVLPQACNASLCVSLNVTACGNSNVE